ncbi:hypothetical protein INT43_000034, partial [Umbelopsis isabellina]
EFCYAFQKNGFKGTGCYAQQFCLNRKPETKRTKNMGKRNFELDQIPDMTGKVCIVTGGNTGIGKVSALELAKHNAHVILAARTPSKGQAAAEEIKAETKNDKVEFMKLDLLSLSSVMEFVKDFKAKNLPLHLLLNNAGVMACPWALSEEGIESQFATNHLAPFYLTTQLLPILEQSQPSRIVNISSLAHKSIIFNGLSLNKIQDKSSYNARTAYARSKACNILFTRELAQRLEKKNVKNLYVNSCHPGVVDTEIARYATFPFKQIIDWMKINPQDGALTQLYLSTSPEIEKKDIRGKYYVPFASEATPQSHSTSQKNQTELWDYTEKILREKIPGYTDAGI